MYVVMLIQLVSDFYPMILFCLVFGGGSYFLAARYLGENLKTYVVAFLAGSVFYPILNIAGLGLLAAITMKILLIPEPPMSGPEAWGGAFIVGFLVPPFVFFSQFLFVLFNLFLLTTFKKEDLEKFRFVLLPIDVVLTVFLLRLPFELYMGRMRNPELESIIGGLFSH